MTCNFEHIQIKRGTYAGFEAANPILKDGEPSYTILDTTPIIKIGDGVTNWKDLPCFVVDGTNCDVSTTTTTNPEQPPPPNSDECDPMMCVAFIDESDDRRVTPPNTPDRIAYFFNKMLEIFPNRLCFVFNAKFNVANSTSHPSSSTKYWDSINEPLKSGPTQRFFDTYHNLLGTERQEYRITPKDTGGFQEAWRESGGAWYDINTMIDNADPSIREIFNNCTQMAIFIDGSGSTLLRHFTKARDQLITDAATERQIRNVAAITNTYENAACPFCQPECCGVIQTEELLEKYNQLKEECITSTKSRYPECELE